MELSNGRLASASNDLSIRFWDLSTYSAISSITSAHIKPVLCIRQLTGNYLASGSSGDGGSSNGPNLKVLY